MRRYDERGRNIDRRRAQRAPLERDAYFVPGNIEVLPQTGQALDVSRDGVLIRTSRPLPEGTSIEVEMRPDRWQPGARLILTRGQVARIVDRGNGDYDMGVRLHVSPGHRAPFAGPRYAKHAMHDLGSLMANLRPRELAHAHAHRSSWKGALPRNVRFRESARQAAPASSGWKSWRWPLALLAAGLLLLLLWPWLLRDVHPDGDLQRYPAQQVSEPVEQEVLPLRRVPVTPVAPSNTPNDGVIHPDAIEPLPETTPPVTDLTWPEPVRSRVRDADYPAARQNPGPGTGGGGSPHSFYGSSESAARSTPQYSAVDGVVLDVDRRAHRMRLFVDGALREEFRIGLGQDGSTPNGDFTIGNKLTDPDWYNRGDVVRAGDPDNPIGRRWMGLSRNGALTPYGIHPTNELDSVGDNRSRGCIRVRPEDADTLFRLCPVGARVVIR